MKITFTKDDLLRATPSGMKSIPATEKQVDYAMVLFNQLNFAWPDREAFILRHTDNTCRSIKACTKSQASKIISELVEIKTEFETIADQERIVHEVKLTPGLSDKEFNTLVDSNEELNSSDDEDIPF